MHPDATHVMSHGKANTELLLELAGATFALLEKVAALNLNASRTSFEDSVRHARTLLDARDTQQLIALNLGAVQPMLEQAAAYQRGLLALADESRAHATRLLEAHSEATRRMWSLLGPVPDRFAGNDVAVAALESALAATHSAYETFANMVKPGAEPTEAQPTPAAAKKKEKAPA
jgi:phasin family protein